MALHRVELLLVFPNSSIDLSCKMNWMLNLHEDLPITEHACPHFVSLAHTQLKILR